MPCFGSLPYIEIRSISDIHHICECLWISRNMVSREMLEKRLHVACHVSFACLFVGASTWSRWLPSSWQRGIETWPAENDDLWGHEALQCTYGNPPSFCISLSATQAPSGVSKVLEKGSLVNYCTSTALNCLLNLVMYDVTHLEPFQQIRKAWRDNDWWFLTFILKPWCTSSPVETSPRCLWSWALIKRWLRRLWKNRGRIPWANWLSIPGSES